MLFIVAFYHYTNDAARLHSVLVNLHQVVGQVAQLWLHALQTQPKLLVFESVCFT